MPDENAEYLLLALPARLDRTVDKLEALLDFYLNVLRREFFPNPNALAEAFDRAADLASHEALRQAHRALANRVRQEARSGRFERAARRFRRANG